MRFDVRVEGAEALRRRLGERAAELDRELIQAVGATAERISMEMQVLTKSRTVREALQTGRFVRVSERRPQARVIVPFPGRFVERGRRAGKAPPLEGPRAERFLRWAREHGVTPFLAARAIARRGVVGTPFIGAAVHAGQAYLQVLVRHAIARLARK